MFVPLSKCGNHESRFIASIRDQQWWVLLNVNVRQWWVNTPGLETKTNLLCCSSGVLVKTMRKLLWLNYDYTLQQSRKQYLLPRICVYCVKYKSTATLLDLWIHGPKVCTFPYDMYRVSVYSTYYTILLGYLTYSTLNNTLVSDRLMLYWHSP